MAESIKGETKHIAFKFTDVATMMVRDAGIHEGFWSMTVRFGINAANVALNNAPPAPTAIVPILEIGLFRENELGPLAVDAAKVNPKPRTKKGPRTTKTTKKK